MHIFIVFALFSKNKKWNGKNTADVLDKQLCKDALRACPGRSPPHPQDFIYYIEHFIDCIIHHIIHNYIYTRFFVILHYPIMDNKKNA